MNILQLLANDGFICVNKNLIQILGLEEAILIGELASIYIYNKNKDLLEDDWFYATQERVQNETGLSDYTQRQVVEKLCNLGILEQKFNGMPKRKFLRFNLLKLYEMLINQDDVLFPKFREHVPQIYGACSANLESMSSKITEHVPQNYGTIYNNTITNNIDNNTNNTLAGGFSNENNTTEILEKNTKNQPAESGVPAPPPPPPIVAPKITPKDRIPKKLLDKLIPWNAYPETVQALENYILFLIDTYNTPQATIKGKLTQICRMAGNSPKGIEIICSYNIDRNYKNVYKPSDYKKQLADCSVISEEFTGEFATDENGEIEEIW